MMGKSTANSQSPHEYEEAGKKEDNQEDTLPDSEEIELGSEEEEEDDQEHNERPGSSNPENTESESDETDEDSDEDSDEDEDNDNEAQALAWYNHALFMIAGTAFFGQQLLVDGFDISFIYEQMLKAIERFRHDLGKHGSEEHDHDIELPLFLVAGLPTVLLSSMMLSLVFTYYLKKQKPHDHSHHHPHTGDIEHATENPPAQVDIVQANHATHPHIYRLIDWDNVKHQATDWCIIGGPFGMIAYSAGIETVEEFFPGSGPGTQIPSATIFALLSTWGMKTIHGFFAHKASHGQGAKEFLKTFIETFFTKLKGAKDAWVKWGILIGHLCEGVLAGSWFSKATGLNKFPYLSIPLQISLPILITLFEGITEGTCVDSANKRKNTQEKLKFWQYMVNKAPLECIKWLASSLHALLNVLGGAEIASLILNKTTHLGPDGWQVGGEGGLRVSEDYMNMFLLLISTAILLYPNAKGFKSLIDRPVDVTVKATKKALTQTFTHCKFSNIFHASQSQEASEVRTRLLGETSPAGHPPTQPPQQPSSYGTLSTSG